MVGEFCWCTIALQLSFLPKIPGKLFVFPGYIILAPVDTFLPSPLWELLVVQSTMIILLGLKNTFLRPVRLVVEVLSSRGLRFSVFEE